MTDKWMALSVLDPQHPARIVLPALLPVPHCRNCFRVRRDHDRLTGRCQAGHSAPNHHWESDREEVTG